MLGPQVRFFFPLARNLQIQTGENDPFDANVGENRVQGGFTERFMTIQLESKVLEFK